MTQDIEKVRSEAVAMMRRAIENANFAALALGEADRTFVLATEHEMVVGHEDKETLRLYSLGANQESRACHYGSHVSAAIAARHWNGNLTDAQRKARCAVEVMTLREAYLKAATAWGKTLAMMEAHKT